MFHQPDATAQIQALQPIPSCPAIDSSERGRSAGLRRLCVRPPLTRTVEHDLFCRMNFEKFQAARMEQSVKPRERDEHWHRNHAKHLQRATEIRNVIVESNLRLAVAMAQPFADAEDTLEELVADATLPLIRAVELFDVSRGLCFSTYASHTLRNHYRRVGKRQTRLARRQTQGEWHQFDAVPEDRVLPAEQEQRAQACRRLAREMLTTLPERDQSILKSRFGLNTPSPQTFSEVGESIGLSKERARVLTHRALERLRELRVEEPEPIE
ncbi:sigma-70 family RNA polymerase sigma factor [Thalassoroseus pseudoceratinae]|uniref:sigma-70 family RNA polymerase sigma factor n=1 Tax=Thalassoroseus pseudoceratinae TaxID=2713176 RepID=UPI001421D4C6|nr:sigma-70 family RNA polymerase sigma factor [Thalassoroseus pseudoceratinae]